jgi:hypothetical protein
LGCLPPWFNFTNTFFHRPEIKDALGVPEHVNFTGLSDEVFAEFKKYGDT